MFRGNCTSNKIIDRRQGSVVKEEFLKEAGSNKTENDSLCAGKIKFKNVVSIIYLFLRKGMMMITTSTLITDICLGLLFSENVRYHYCCCWFNVYLEFLKYIRLLTLIIYFCY